MGTITHGSSGPPHSASQTHLDRFNRFWHGSRQWQTDRQTDRQSTLLM